VFSVALSSSPVQVQTLTWTFCSRNWIRFFFLNWFKGSQFLHVMQLINRSIIKKYSGFWVDFLTFLTSNFVTGWRKNRFCCSLNESRRSPVNWRILLLSQTASVLQRGGERQPRLFLFVCLTSLRSVKSEGHWSESPSHWLFLYVKPSNVALQRYHETCLTCRLMPPRRA